MCNWWQESQNFKKSRLSRQNIEILTEHISKSHRNIACVARHAVQAKMRIKRVKYRNSTAQKIGHGSIESNSSPVFPPITQPASICKNYNAIAKKNVFILQKQTKSECWQLYKLPTNLLHRYVFVHNFGSRAPFLLIFFILFLSLRSIWWYNQR